jgi:hypothetical protein
MEMKQFSVNGRKLKENKKTEDIETYRKEWYKKNRDKMLEHMARMIVCECGLNIKYSNANKHVRTMKHEYFMQKILTNQ